MTQHPTDEAEKRAEWVPPKGKIRGHIKFAGIIVPQLSDLQAIRLVEAINAALTDAVVIDAPIVEGNDPVLWQYRYFCSALEKWSTWETVNPRIGQTVESYVQEIRDYIADGKRYELRALYAQGRTQSALPEGLFPDKNGNGGFIQDLCFTVWQLCHNPKHEDGNTDWFNDTKPTVMSGIEKIKAMLSAAPPVTGGDRKYECPICREQFSEQAEYAGHCYDQHNGVANGK